MKLNTAKEVLENNGFEVRETDAMKGSCRVTALNVGDGDFRIALYERSLEQIESEKELLSFVEESLSRKPEIDKSLFHDRDYLLSHAVSCIRHATDDQKTVKWTFEDLEEYIRVYLNAPAENGVMSMTVTESLLEQTGIDKEEIHQAARKNLEEQTVITGMQQMIAEMIGSDGMEGLFPEMPEKIYVATTKNKLHGASVMLLNDVLSSFCREHCLKEVALVPCSINEILLVDSNLLSEEEINAMIIQVNREQVDEWERLSDHVYFYTLPETAAS